MWQIITFFVVINALSAFINWANVRDMPFKISRFNTVLYIFIGGACGVLFASWVLKVKTFKTGFVLVALIENVGVYFLFYEIAIHLH